MKIEKLCLFCEHFYFNTGDPDWSDVTPGDDAEMGCNKGVITLDLFDDTLTSYRQKIMTAQNCLEYELSLDMEID